MDFAEFQRDREFLPHDHTRVQESQHMSENEQNAQSQLIWAAGQIKWPHEMCFNGVVYRRALWLFTSDVVSCSLHSSLCFI